MKKRIFSMLLTLCMLCALMPVLPARQADAAPASEIKVGDYVQMGVYNDTPILWRCVAVDSNGPLMLADKAIDTMQADATGSFNTEGSHARRLGGTIASNYWGDSNIRTWLNSGADAGTVKWIGPQPEYSQEAGFLTNFTPEELSAVKEVTQKSILASADSEIFGRTGNELFKFSFSGHVSGTSIYSLTANYDRAYAEQTTEKMFLPDVKQVYAVYQNANVLGEDYYKGAYNGDEKVSYWLRTPNPNNADGMIIANSNGVFTAASADSNTIGVRPAFYFNTQSSILYAGSGTAENPYARSKFRSRSVLGVTGYSGKDTIADLSKMIEYEDGSSASGRFTYTIEGENAINASIDGDTLTIPKGLDAGEYSLTVSAVEKGSLYALTSVGDYDYTPVTTDIRIVIYSPGEIKVGDYIRLGEYNGTPIVWRCVNIDENGPLMLADKILCRKVFDSLGNFRSGSHSARKVWRDTIRHYWSSNYWGDSNLRCWLNSDAAAGEVKWRCGIEADYSGEAGFLTNFTPEELSTVKEVTQKAILARYDIYGSEYSWWVDQTKITGYARFQYNSDINGVMTNYDIAYAEALTDKMFLLDVKQLYDVYQNGDILGEDYYAGAYEGDQKICYWLRTPVHENQYLVRISNPDGSVGDTAADDNTTWAYYPDHVGRCPGVRPAFYLDEQSIADFINSGDGTAANPYKKLKFSGRSVFPVSAYSDSDTTVDLSEIVEYEDGIDTSDRFTYTIEGENTLNASIDGDTMTIPKGADGGIYTLTVNAVEKESQSTLASINKYGHSPFTTNISIIMYDIGDTQTGKNIQIGEYVRMGEYNGKPIIWRCVDIDENGPLMLADKVIDIKVMDAGGNSFGSSSHGTRLNNYGSNYWGDSNIRSWLNSDAAAGMVDWPCGKPPSQYSGEAGFLTNFTPDELGAIKEVSQKAILASCDVDENNQPKWYTVGENFTGTEPFELVENIEDVTANYDNAYAEYITDKMFLPDVKQLYTVYEIFGDDYYAGAYNLQDENSDKVSYWLRTPKANSVGGQRKADPNGAVTETPANANGIGVRPAFYLNTQSVGFKSGDGTTENPYSVRRNVFGGEDPIEIRATYGYENRIIDNLSKYMAYADGHSTANEFTYTIEGENTVGASINGDTLTVPTGLEPGEYPLTVKAVENEPKYTLASIYKYGSAPVMLNIKVIIQKLEPEMTVTGKSLSYTGSAQELVTGTAKGGTLVYSLSENGDYSEKVATAVSAGNYTVWYKVIGDATHNDSEPQSVTASIAKVTAAATVKANELVFKNRDQYLVTGKTNDGTLVYSTSENGEYSEKIPTGKDVGDYTVWYKVIGDSNHTDSAPRATTASIKNIVGISIEKKPINTTIIEGMPFDASGLKVTADCGDGETFEVLGYTLSGYDTSKVGEQTVTVTYAGKTAEFKITVEAKSMTNIELTHRPDKLTYYQGDALDIAGMVITAFYNNNTSEFINNSDCTVSGSADNVGEQTVTVTYNGQTVKFTVTVLERPVETQTVETPLIETADFYGGKRAIISCATDGADIYYTTDGSDPTTASEKYAAPIELTESAEIKAVAVKSDMNDSAVSGKTVTVERVAAPVASLTGEVEVGTTVSLLSSTAGAEIYYTFGDSLDETNYKKYTDEIVITGSTKIRAVAAKRGYAQSEGVTFEYTIAPPEEEEEPSETNRALLDAGETMCKAGNTFSLPAYIYSEKAVSDFRYTLSFDSDKFEYIGFEAGEDVPASAVSVTANENNVTVRGAVDGLTAAEACVLIFKAKSDVEADDYLLPVDDIDINTADNSLTDIWYLDGLVSIIPEGTSITASAFLSDADDNIIENTEDVKGNVTAWILAETAEEMPEGGEPISFDIILAFYDTNGALVKVDTLEAELSGEMDLFEKEISIPENTEIGDVKLMVWDNTGTMKPLMEATPVVHPYGYELGE